MEPSRLGRSLDAILGGATTDAPVADQRILELPVRDIHPNPNQPRAEFDPDALAELADSIRRNGVLQPVIVRTDADGYQLIAGERRWRAAAQAGLTTIPSILRAATDNESLELALIENIQRQDLNPIEQARAYKDLIERCALTQEEAASRLGKKRSSVANILRLLDLPQDIQDAVSRGTLTMGHARALLGLSDRAEMRRLAARIQRDDLSVRMTERIVADRLRRAKPTRGPEGPKPPHIIDLEAKLRTALGTRVTVLQNKSLKKGRIVIDFFSEDDFQRLLELLLPAPAPAEPTTGG